MPAAEFVSLADIVLRGASAPAMSEDAEPRADAVGAGAPPLAAVSYDAGAAPAQARDAGMLEGDDLHAALRDARLFRARLADAFDEALSRLLRELATAVLARELLLAPCDLAAIAARIRRAAPVTRVRVSPADARRIDGMLADAHAAEVGGAGDVRVIADATLADGDAIVELAHGAVDARLGVRLAVALDAFA